MNGSDVANELVEWFNAVDLTYRTDLRELNDLNQARFEAKLGEGLSSLRADLERQIGGVRQEIAEGRMATEAMGGQLRVEMAVLRADLIKWMFLFWLGTIAANLAARFL